MDSRASFRISGRFEVVIRRVDGWRRVSLGFRPWASMSYHHYYG